MAQLAARLGGRIAPESSGELLTGVALPSTARRGDLTFDVVGSDVGRGAWDSAASAVITAVQSDDPRAYVVENVLRACARVPTWLPVQRTRARETENHHVNIHATATVADNVDCKRAASIGEGAVIGPGVVLGDGVRVGSYCHIGAMSVVDAFTIIGNRVSIGAGCSIGEDGFAFVRDGESWLRVPCFGSVSIGDDCSILAHVVIHAGVFGDTIIGNGCALDSQVLVGHDSRIGRDSAIAGQTAVAGAARIGRGCRIGGKVGIGEGVAIADGVTVTAMSMVARSLERPNSSYSSGWPAEGSARWWRRVSRFRKMLDGQP
jgi:UDP-3-O-[3-hydroxymyristoyl] glucosamine N-acyltransferase